MQLSDTPASRGRKPSLRPFFKILVIMQWTTVLWCIAFTQLSAASYGQQVTLSERDAPLSKIFRQIGSQTGYSFVYTKEDIRRAAPVTIKAQDMPLGEVLELCFRNQPLTFSLNKDIIIVKPRPAPLPAEPEKMVAGTVTDSATGQPLPGVTVRVEGTSLGTVTDEAGRFSLRVPDSLHARLLITLLGYNRKVIASDDPSLSHVALTSSTSGLNELVVIGYGEQKRKDVTGAISSIKPEQIAHLPALRVDELLEGRVAGAQITSETGEPGTGTTVEIRGSRSITASNEPLYVVDGVLDAGDLNTINPQDIASIEVLKDASATAIYGSRGANGVIIITTKRGKAGKDRITFSSTVGFAQLPKYLKLMNAEQWATMVNENTLLSNPNTPAEDLPYPNPDSLGAGTNWTKAVTRTAPFQSHNLSLTGGSSTFTYYLSGSYTNQVGIIKASGYKRYQFRINLEKQLSKTFKTGMTINYANSTRQNNLVNIGSNAGWYYSTLTIPPVMDITTADGAFEDWNPAWYAGGIINTPVALVNLEKDNTKATSLLSNFFASWEILPGLTLKSSFSYIDNHSDRYRYYPGTLPARAAKDQGGYAYQYASPSNQVLNENLLTYAHTWQQSHHLNLLAGWTYQEKKTSDFAASGNGYFVDGMGWNSLQSAPSKDLTSITSGYSSQTIVSGLGRLNYNYRGKYYLTLTGRADGSSNFSANHKWAFFPSGALKWQVTEEKFMQSAKAISDLDLRLSYGSTGNQAISPYQSLPQLAVNTNGYVFDGSGIPVAYYPGKLPNDQLTWETSREINIGADLALFDNRIKLTADVYSTQTHNLLLAIQVPQQTGYSTRLVNLGKTRNRGVELLLNTVNVRNRHFEWSSIFTFAHNDQEVLDLGPLVQVITHTNYTAAQYPMYAYQVGLPTSAIFGAVYAGIWRSDDDIAANKDKYVSIPNFYKPGRPRYVDQNHDGKLDQNDCVYLGQADPKFYGGVDNDFTYKGFEIDFYWEFSGGNKMYNDAELEMGTGSLLTNQFAYMLDRWNAKTNPDSDIPMVNSYDHVPNTRFVHDASYVRLKSARIGYHFDPQKLGIRGITNASFYLSGVNLLLFTHYNGYDPEVNTQGTSSTVRRNDDGAYPKSRTLAANLSLTF